MTADEHCVFCQIVAGAFPAEFVHVDDQTMAFMDINPSARGHVLVVPRTHSTDLHDIDPEDLAACMRTAKAVASTVVDALGANGVNILQNTGRAAGQAVFHFHIHVIPRYAADDLRGLLSPRPGDPQEIAEAAAAIRGE
jgi:histidine triad (HIT) family protein